MQAVQHRLTHQRVIGNANFAFQILRASDLIRKNRGKNILGAHPLNVGRHFAAAHETQYSQRPRQIPTPAHREHRRSQQGLAQNFFYGGGSQICKNQIERKRMLFRERQHDAVIGSCGLQLKIERPAEAFAQRESPSAIDARAKRRVNHQLHAARFVKKSLRDDGLLRGHYAQNRAPCLNICDGLFRAQAVQSAFVVEQFERRFSAFRDFFAQCGDGR